MAASVSSASSSSSFFFQRPGICLCICLFFAFVFTFSSYCPTKPGARLPKKLPPPFWDSVRSLFDKARPLEGRKLQKGCDLSTCWPFDQAHDTESDQYRFQRSNLACDYPNMTKVKLLQLLRLCKAIYFPAWSLISESKLFYFWILIKRITYRNSDIVPEIYMKTYKNRHGTMKNQSGAIKTNLELYRVVMGGSGGYRRLPRGSAHLLWQTDTHAS